MEKSPILPPFKRFCITIGNLPSSYVDSMSYYECLMWLCKYLKDTVVPAVNENAESVNELINWFNNLDVTEEVDNKLDQMVEDGTLAQLIEDYINLPTIENNISILNGKVNTINDTLDNIDNRVTQNSVDIASNTTSINGKVAKGETNSITMPMLAQDVREALTGGSTAVVGEDSVGVNNIQNGAISVFKLDDYLDSTKSISYGDPIDLGERYSDFVYVYEDELQYGSNSAYAHLEYNLTNGKIYSFTGVNVYTACSIVIADSEGNVVYYTPITNSSGVSLTSLVFKVNTTGLKAYVSIWKNLYDNASYDSFFAAHNTPVLREVNIFTNNIKRITPKLVKKLEDYVCYYTYDSYGLPRTYAYEGANEYIYEMVKGKKYKVSSYNWYSVSGIYVLGLDNSVQYNSSDSAVGNNFIYVEREFTASTDGYIVLFEYGANKPTIEIIEDYLVAEEDNNNNLGFSHWITLGDSITESNFRASDNYVSYIQQELGITTENHGHSSAGFYKTNQSDQNFRTEIGEISSYDYETDIITVMGSINDFSDIASHLGQLGDTGTDTIYGCMYQFCNTLFTNYIGARIGIISPTPTSEYNTNKAKFDTYNQALKETAELFSIPYLDLTERCNLKPWIQDFRTEFYTADGSGSSGQVDDTHPNSKGHWLIHNAIKEFIKTL